jgi:hypothetical protein
VATAVALGRGSRDGGGHGDYPRLLVGSGGGGVGVSDVRSCRQDVELGSLGKAAFEVEQGEKKDAAPEVG